jgi:hypothetical protein
MNYDNTSPPEQTSKSTRRWVWWSNAESVAQGQISVLAVLEIPFAFCLFWYLAALSPWPWLTLLALLAAPLLLLRSSASIDMGQKLLRQYLDDSTSLFSQAGQSIFNVAAAISLLWFLYNYVFVEDFSLLNELASLSLILQKLHRANGLFHTALVVLVMAVLTIGVVFISFSISSSFFSSKGASVYLSEESQLKNMARISFSLARKSFVFIFLTASFSIYIASKTDEPAAAFLVVLAFLWILFFLAGFFVKRRSYGTSLFVIVGVVGGVFLRALFLRTWATFCNLAEGCSSYGKNCKETFLIFDSLHLPELMPGASAINVNLGLRGLWTNERGKTLKEMSGLQSFSDALFVIILSLVIYLPTLAYRLNIKANAIIWGSIALAFSRTVWGDEETMREKSAFWTDRYLLYPLFGGLWLMLLTWLLMPTAWLPPTLNGLSSLLPVPALGLRYFMVLIFWGSFSMLIWSSHALRSAHAKALEGAGDYDKYPESVKPHFERQANSVRRWLKINTALAVLITWVWLLWAASDGPLVKFFHLPVWRWPAL